MTKNQIIIVINGYDERTNDHDSNKIVIIKKEEKKNYQSGTFLETDMESVDDLIKAQSIINKQASPINEIIIINRNIDLNMISYQHDYKHIKNNYLILANLLYFINLLISNFNNKLNFILSFENDSHYKVHTNIFNNSIINYLNIFKDDLKGSHSITIKKLD